MKISRRLKAVGLAGLSILLLTGGIVWRSRTPSHERAWRPEQAVLPRVTFAGEQVHVRNVRDFAYRTRDDFTPGYRDRVYHLDRVERVWFGLTPFSRDWRGPAHAFLSFSFSDGQHVAVSVEARREANEKYSLWKGALRKFELMYVIAEERDVVGVRAISQDNPVYLYPVKATPEQARALFTGMMKRAAEVERRPEFYNTFTNNCTTNILDPVNRIATEKIPFGLEILLPGYSDKLAHERGLIDTDLPLEEARARFDVNARARAALAHPDFSARIRR